MPMMVTMITIILVKFKNKDSMKKYLIIALASLFAFASCSKESDETPEMNNDKTVVLTFTSKRPNLKSESKTAWNGETIVWSTGDKIRVGYTIEGNWMGQSGAGTAKFYASNPVAIDTDNASIGTFNVPISESAFTDPEIAGTYVFYGVYPSTSTESKATNAPSLSVSIPETQHPSATSFDSKADLMMGQTAGLALTGLPEIPLEMTWTRMVAHLDLTFKNLSSVPGYTEGEVVTSIKLTANEDAKLTGDAILNLSNKTISSASSNTVTIDASNLSSASNVEAWCCVYPVTISSLNVEVYTNKAKYTRSINNLNLSFKQNARNVLGIKMESATRTELSNTYILVTDPDDLIENSEVIIVAKDYDFAMSTDQKSNNRGQVSITKSTKDGKSVIENPDPQNVQRFSLEFGTERGSTIAFKCLNGEQVGKYIYAAGANSSNYLRSRADKVDEASFTVEFEDEAVQLKAQGGIERNWLRYNSATSGQLFSCYASGQNDVALYKLYGSGEGSALLEPQCATPEITFNQSTNTVTITCSTAGARIGYTIDGTNPGIDDEGDPIGTTEEYSEPFTISETVTVKAFAGASGYSMSEIASKECKVATPEFTTIAQLNALLTEDEPDQYYGTLTNAIVSFVPTTNTAIIKDATGSITYYNSSSSGHGLKQGQTFSGEINVTATFFYLEYSEITAMDVEFTGAETVVSPETVTLSDLNGHYSEYQNAYVQVNDLTVTAVNGKNISVSNNSNTYVVYDNTGNVSASVGDIFNVKGTVTKYIKNSTEQEQIKVWNADDITFTHHTPVTLSSISVNGQKTSFIQNESWSFGGIVTATYSNTTTKDVTASATYSGYDLSTAGTQIVTVSYTENGVTKQTTYEIIVTSAGSPTTYTKITSAPSNWSGTYIMVYEEDDESGLVCTAGEDAATNYVSATINNGVITSSVLSACEIEISTYSSGYSVKALGGTNVNKYLEGKGSGSNGTNFVPSPSKVTSLNFSNEVVTITNNSNVFAFNSAANNLRWRFFKSGTASGNGYYKPALYKKN